jgi:ABC-type multidrug transport system ATPase subunit
MTTILEAVTLSKVYGSERAVDEVSFCLEKGTSTALIGPNGAGKTTTLSMLAGLLNPTKGTISLNGDQHADVGSILACHNILNFFPGSQLLNLLKWLRN